MPKDLWSGKNLLKLHTSQVQFSPTSGSIASIQVKMIRIFRDHKYIIPRKGKAERIGFEAGKIFNAQSLKFDVK